MVIKIIRRIQHFVPSMSTESRLIFLNYFGARFGFVGRLFAIFWPEVRFLAKCICKMILLMSHFLVIGSARREELSGWCLALLLQISSRMSSLAAGFQLLLLEHLLVLPLEIGLLLFLLMIA